MIKKRRSKMTLSTICIITALFFSNFLWMGKLLRIVLTNSRFLQTD
jgi:hypothetical protein